jgi:hypothetical protein
MNTIALLLASLATTTIPQATDTVDVLIRNGLVYDGSGGTESPSWAMPVQTGSTVTGPWTLKA